MHPITAQRSIFYFGNNFWSKMSRHATPYQLTMRLMEFLNTGDDSIADEIISESKWYSSEKCIASSHTLKQVTMRLIRILCPEQVTATVNPELKPRYTLWGPHSQMDVGKYSNILSFQKKAVLLLKIFGLARIWGLLWEYRLQGKRYMSWHSRKLLCLATTERRLCAHDAWWPPVSRKCRMAKLLRATWCSISWDCYSNLELSVFHPSDISDGCRCCTWRSVDTPVLSSLTPRYGIPFFLCAKEGGIEDDNGGCGILHGTDFLQE